MLLVNMGNMGNTIRPFTKQATYSSESSSGREDSDRNGGAEAAECFETGSRSVLSSFVSIPDNTLIPQPDSGLFSVENDSHLEQLNLASGNGKEIVGFRNTASWEGLTFTIPNTCRLQ